MHFIVSWKTDLEDKMKLETLADKPDEIRRLSQASEQGGAIWSSWAERSGGSIISLGIGHGVLEIPAEHLTDLESIRAQFAQKAGVHVAVGVGSKPSDADTALKVAVKNGGDKIVLFSDELYKELEESVEEREADDLAGLVGQVMQKYDPSFIDPDTLAAWKRMGMVTGDSVSAEAPKPAPETPKPPAPANQWDKGDHYSNGDIKIPKSTNPQREVYDKNYLKAIENHFLAPGLEFRPVIVDTDTAEFGHYVDEKTDRRGRIPMYRQMARDGERLTPLVVVRQPQGHFKVTDGNGRLYSAKKEGVKQVHGYEVVDTRLAKAIPGARALAGLGAAAALAFPSIANSPVAPPQPLQVQTPPPAHKEWNVNTLAHELHPIAWLESRFNHAAKHAKNSGGEFATAFGALGLKPNSAHDTYIKTPKLQQLYPGLTDHNKFLSKLKEDPDFYNKVGEAHWARLKHWGKGSLSWAAYAWRHGDGAARGASPDAIASDPYVKTYLNRFKTAGNYTVNSPAVKAPKPPQQPMAMSKAEGGDAQGSMSAPALLGGAGGGMAGAMRPAAPAAPVKPATEASEHTQGEAAQSILENEMSAPEMTHAAKDLEDELHGHADKQAQDDKQNQDDDESAAEREEIKQQVVSVLQKLKGQGQTLEAIKGKNPELYNTITGVVQSMIMMAKVIAGDGTDEQGMSKSEQELLKMALGDIPAGEPVQNHPATAEFTYYKPEILNYTHLLNDKQKKAGYALVVAHTPHVSRALAFHNGKSVGYVGGKISDEGYAALGMNPGSKHLSVGGSLLDQNHRGQGMGSAMYEALMAHAFHNGATAITGDVHSSMADYVHRKLSAKHKLGYKPKPNVGKGRTYETKQDFDYAPNEEYDDKFKEYKYNLKAEEPITKGVHIPTVVKPPPVKVPMVLPSGSFKDGEAPDANPARRSGQIKVTEDGKDRWRQVRSGMVMNPQSGQPVSSLTVPKSVKTDTNQ